MNRTRALIAIVSIAMFVVAGGVVIYASTHTGGQNRTFDVTVTGAAVMTPSTLQPVHVDDTVTINVKSDQDGEVHVHVYDIALPARAGRTVSHTFKADKTCTCDIEWESTNAPLGALIVSP